MLFFWRDPVPFFWRILYTYKYICSFLRKLPFRIEEIKWEINSTIVFAKGEPKGTTKGMVPSLRCKGNGMGNNKSEIKLWPAYYGVYGHFAVGSWRAVPAQNRWRVGFTLWALSSGVRGWKTDILVVWEAEEGTWLEIKYSVCENNEMEWKSKLQFMYSICI